MTWSTRALERIVRREDPAHTQLWTSALGALEDRHVLRRENREGTGRYRLVDPFLAAWLDVAQSV